MPFQIYLEMKEVEVGIDSVWTYTSGLIEEHTDGRDLHVGITRAYPASWITNTAQSNKILSDLLNTPPVTRILILSPSPMMRVSTILATRELIGKIDSTLPVLIPSGY